MRGFREKGTVLFRRRGCGIIGSTVVSTGRGPIPLSSTIKKKVKGSRLEVGGGNILD